MVRIFTAAALVVSLLATSVVARPVHSWQLRGDSNSTDVSSNSTDLSNSTNLPTYSVASNVNDTSSSNSSDSSNSNNSNNSLPGDMSDGLESIGRSISSNWRSNSGETVIVQTVVKSLVVTQVTEQLEIQQSDVQRIVDQVSSFGIDINQGDVSGIIANQISQRSQTQIIVEMLQSIVNIVDVSKVQVTEQVEQVDRTVAIANA